MSIPSYLPPVENYPASANGKKSHESQPNGEIGLHQDKKMRVLDHPYEEFLKLLVLVNASWGDLFDEIDSVCNVRTLNPEEVIESLKLKFSIEQVRQLSGIIQWTCVFDLGVAPGCMSLDDPKRYEAIKQYLGINYCIDVLTHDLIPDKKLNAVSLTDLCRMLQESCSNNNANKVEQHQSEFEKLQKKLLDFIFINLAPEKSFNEDLLMDDVVIEKLMPLVRELDRETQLRIILISSIAAFSLFATQESLTAKPNVFPSTLPQNLIPVIQEIDKCMLKFREPAITRNEIDLHQDKKRRILDPYEKFWNLVQLLDDIWDDFFDEFDFVCKVQTLDQNQGIEKYKSMFSIEQIEQLSGIMQWIYVMDGGLSPGLRDPDASEHYEATKQYLGIKDCIDILTHDLIPDKKLNTVSLPRLCRLLESRSNGKTTEVEQSHQEFEKLQKHLLAFIVDWFSVQRTLNELKMSSDDFEMIIPLIRSLGLEMQLRIILFSSFAANHLISRQESLIAKPKEASSLSQNLILIINTINKSLVRCWKPEYNEDPIPLRSDKPFLPLPRQEFVPHHFGRVNLPGMPNWMPNGGNSCYISSTIWSLYFLLNREIQAKIQVLEAVNVEEEESIKNARNSFIQLYKAMSSQEDPKINANQVNSFRSLIQTPESYRAYFASPGRREQEDAYDILICMIKDVLKLQPFSAGAPEFLKRHIYTNPFEQALVEPEFYDYSLGSSYCKEALYTVDIGLGVKAAHKYQTLNQLVTGERQTEDIDKTAEKTSDNHNGPKSRTFKTKHAEQVVVESEQNAPHYFIGRLTRFSSDDDHGRNQHKRFDIVVPNATLEFYIKGRENEDIRVPYDLVAITTHSGWTINGGHYYTYVRTLVDNEWRFFKYDDITGPSKCQNHELVIQDAALNGYIFYYKKRDAQGLPPTRVPFEDDPSQINARINSPTFSSPSSPTISTSSSSTSSISNPIFNRTISNHRDIITEDVKAPLPPSGRTTQVPKPSKMTHAEQWIKTMQLSKNFQIHRDRTVYDSLRALFISHFPASEETIIMIEETVKDKEFLQNVSLILGIPIYLIDPIADRDLHVDSHQKLVLPTLSYSFGEDIDGKPIFYVFHHLDGGYSVIEKID